MKKLLLFLVVCCIIFSVGCEKDVITSEPDASKDSLSDEYEYEDDGIVEGDYGGEGSSENLFIEDGRIFISKEPYFVLYLKSSGTVLEKMHPDLPPVRAGVDRNPTEVVLENNGHIEHLYTFMYDGLVGECKLVLIKDKSKIPPWEYKENVTIYNRYSDGVNKPNGEDKSCSDFKSFIDDSDNPKDFIMAYIFK